MARSTGGARQHAVTTPLDPSIQEDLLRRQLERREQLCLVLEGLIEGMGDGVVALDARGSLIHMTDGLREPASTGATASTVALRPIAPERTTDRDLPRSVLTALRREARRIRPAETIRFDLAWPRPEVGSQEYRVTGAAGEGLDGEGRLLTLFAFHDRTREAALERELEQARDLAALGQMAATVAHEVRNPLGAIQGFATLLQRDVADQPGPLRQVTRILQGVEAANRIVSDLLEFCRPVRLQVEPLSLEGLLAESIAALRQADWWPPRVDLDLEVAPDLPICRGDRQLLLQVLANLYRNAAGAMGATGVLSIRARASGSPTQPDRLRLVVRDTGCGLGADEVARIFQPFYSTRPGGTGLGLPLVRKIIDAHGGHVHVVSAPGRGTSVVLDLPAAPPVRARGHRPSGCHAGGGVVSVEEAA